MFRYVCAAVQKKIHIGLVVGAYLFLIPINPVVAAEVIKSTNDLMGCSILVSGPITQGDAAKLNQIITEEDNEYIRSLAASTEKPEPDSSPSGRRICFDSVGGSMTEALEIVDVLRREDSLESHYVRGTAVGPGARCESACALAFMGGSWEPPHGEGRVVANRVMHPKALLGFHRPSLEIKSGQYSEAEVNRAFSVALDAVGSLIDKRDSYMYKFPESLLNSMLNTPANEMHYIETVGDAARISVQVAPSPFYNESLQAIVSNVCLNIDSQLTDYGFNPYFSPRLDGVSVENDGYVELLISSGFREEASSGCTVRISNKDSEYNSAPSGYAFIGEYDPDRYGSVYPFHTFPAKFKLKDIEGDYSQSWAYLLSLANKFYNKSKGSVKSCLLMKDRATVINVNEYVNVRQGPNFSAPVARQLYLGELVNVLDGGGVQLVGSAEVRQSCLISCQDLDNTPDNESIRDAVQKCVDDNVLWSEISDSNGNSGWVSRKFLKEAD